MISKIPIIENLVVLARSQVPLKPQLSLVFARRINFFPICLKLVPVYKFRLDVLLLEIKLFVI